MMLASKKPDFAAKWNPSKKKSNYLELQNAGFLSEFLGQELMVLNSVNILFQKLGLL